MEYALDHKKDAARVLITGGITEKSAVPLQKMVAELRGKVKHVDFDCSGVNAINSTGVAHWVGMLQELDNGISYEFSRCSIFFVDYANLIPDITNDAPIVSFYAPMKCEACGKGHAPLLLTADVDLERGFGLHKCSACKGTLVGEVDPEDYLSFLEE